MTINTYFKKLVDYGFFDLKHSGEHEHIWWANFVEDCMQPEKKETLIIEKDLGGISSADSINLADWGGDEFYRNRFGKGRHIFRTNINEHDI